MDCVADPRELSASASAGWLNHRLLQLNQAEIDMVGPGLNLATTKDGEAYNKLQRPSQNYLASTAPPLALAKPPPTDASPFASIKRKRSYADATTGHKRTRLEQRKTPLSTSLAAASKEELRDPDCGMRTMLPILDDGELSSDSSTGEALAYLRSVR